MIQASLCWLLRTVGFCWSTVLCLHVQADGCQYVKRRENTQNLTYTISMPYPKFLII